MVIQKKISVIGAGWYGCHIALSLLNRGFEVSLYEKEKSIFSKASGFNQNRLHQGFHYPRCKTTRQQSKRGYHLFRKHYEFLVRDLNYNLYAVPKRESLIDFETFKDIMTTTGLRFEDVSAVSPFSLLNIEGSVDCEEAVIDPFKAKKHFNKCLSGVLHLGSNITPEELKVLQATNDFVIDCTWGGLQPNSEHYYESCIYFIGQSERYRNMGLTLMDGEFFSIYPCSDEMHTITHVTHTPIENHMEQSAAYESIEKLKRDEVFIEEKKSSMSNAIELYYPKFCTDFEIVDVKFAVKTKPITNLASRYVTVETENNLIKVQSGKIDTVFDAESTIMKVILS